MSACMDRTRAAQPLLKNVMDLTRDLCIEYGYVDYRSMLSRIISRVHGNVTRRGRKQRGLLISDVQRSHDRNLIYI